MEDPSNGKEVSRVVDTSVKDADRTGVARTVFDVRVAGGASKVAGETTARYTVPTAPR